MTSSFVDICATNIGDLKRTTAPAVRASPRSVERCLPPSTQRGLPDRICGFRLSASPSLRPDATPTAISSCPSRPCRSISSSQCPRVCLAVTINEIVNHTLRLIKQTTMNKRVLMCIRNSIEASRMKGMPLSKRIENNREAKTEYSNETKSCGIVTLRNCYFAEL